MPIVRNEAQVQLALLAMERDEKLSLRKAAKLYSVAPMTLSKRRKRIRSRIETIFNSRNLD